LGSIGFLSRSTRWKSTIPYYIKVLLERGQPNTNFDGEFHVIRLFDIRDHQEKFKLDNCGFQVVPCSIPIPFRNPTEIQKSYIPAMQEFLRELLKADEVKIFHFQVNSMSAFFGLWIINSVIRGEMPVTLQLTNKTLSKGLLYMPTSVSDESARETVRLC